MSNLNNQITVGDVVKQWLEQHDNGGSVMPTCLRNNASDDQRDQSFKIYSILLIDRVIGGKKTLRRLVRAHFGGDEPLSAIRLIGPGEVLPEALRGSGLTEKHMRDAAIREFILRVESEMVRVPYVAPLKMEGVG